MKNLKNMRGVLRYAGRLPNSKNGNPRYLLGLDNSDQSNDYRSILFVTKPDSSLAYDIERYFNRSVSVVIGEHYGRRTLSEVLCSYGRG